MNQKVRLPESTSMQCADWRPDDSWRTSRCFEVGQHSVMKAESAVAPSNRQHGGVPGDIDLSLGLASGVAPPWTRPSH
jgi:hypothetical protein